MEGQSDETRTFYWIEFISTKLIGQTREEIAAGCKLEGGELSKYEPLRNEIFRRRVHNQC